MSLLNPFFEYKISATIQTCPIKIVNSILIIEKEFNSPFLKIIGLRNQLPITFGTALMRIEVNNSPPHTNF